MRATWQWDHRRTTTPYTFAAFSVSITRCSRSSPRFSSVHLLLLFSLEIHKWSQMGRPSARWRFFLFPSIVFKCFAVLTWLDLTWWHQRAQINMHHFSVSFEFDTKKNCSRYLFMRKELSSHLIRDLLLIYTCFSFHVASENTLRCALNIRRRTTHDFVCTQNLSANIIFSCNLLFFQVVR